jgi:hypothetical protein
MRDIIRWSSFSTNHKIPIIDLQTKAIQLDPWNFEDSRKVGGRGVVYEVHAWYIPCWGLSVAKGNKLESTCSNGFPTFGIGDSVNFSTEDGMLQ